MSQSSNVIYRDLDVSPSLTQSIEKKLSKLNRFSDRIFSSRVVLDTEKQLGQKNHIKGKVYSAHLDIDVNGQSVVIQKDADSIQEALKDAFSAAEAKLKRLNHRTKQPHKVH